MKPRERYTPADRKSPMSAAATWIFAAAVAALWYFRNKLALSVADMLILTGIALLMILLHICNIKRRNKITDDAQELLRRQDEIGTDDYSDSSIFFRDK